MATPLISIIIIHYNNEEQTLNCLRSLEAVVTDNFRYNVIIIDNGSQKTFELPSTFSEKKFITIHSATNLGFSGGNNLGVQYAVEHYNSDYIVLLNNDTVVDKYFLKEMYRVKLAHPEAGVVSPLIYFMPNREFHQGYRREEIGNIIWFAGGSIDWKHLAAFHRGVDEVDRGQFNEVQEMDFATGCCMLITREVLEKTGVFDERYFLYLEDVDLSLRIRNLGYSLILAPEAHVWHENAGSSGGPGLATQDYYMTRNSFLFAFLHAHTKNKYTALRLLFRNLTQGNEYQRKAVLHFLTAQFGKQPVI